MGFGHPARRYDESMRRKVAVSLPADLVAGAERAVAEGQAASVSAYVSEALAERAKRDRLVEVLDAMDRELGRPRARDRAWARRVLGG